MTGEVRRRAEARRDSIDICRRLAREAGSGVAQQFRASAEAAFRRLAGSPVLGVLYEAENPAFDGVRYFPLSSRYRNYFVFYLTIPGGVEVVRVLHGARDIAGILMDEFEMGEEEGPGGK